MSSRGSKSNSSISDPSDKKFLILVSLIVVIYNVLIFNYIVQLEDKKCGCITDWRHDFIKYFSAAIVIWGMISILFELMTSKNGFVKFIKTILNCGSLINIWCLYTYVGDLDKTKCMCAIDTQKNMHYFLYIWRYILVGTLILGLMGIISVALKSKK